MIQSISNHIAVKTTVDELFCNTVRIGADKVLFFPANFEPEKNVRTTFEVASVPSELYCSELLQAEYTVGRTRNKPMPHLTDMEIQVGDTVYCGFGGVMDSIGKLAGPDVKNHNRKYVVEGETIYILIHYADVLAVKRGDVVFPVNGLVFAELVREREKRYESSVLELPKGIGTPDAYKYAKIVSVGKKCRGYIRPSGGRFKFINDDFWEENYVEALSPGDIVRIKDNAYVPVSFNIGNELRNLVYLRRWHIYGIMEGMEIE